MHFEEHTRLDLRELKLKICGMREQANIREVSHLLPDYMGFIFYPASQRYAGTLNEEWLAGLSSQIKKTGVFVNAKISEISTCIRRYHLDAVQLHGSEPAELCRRIMDEGVEVIKAFGVDESFDFNILRSYSPSTDYFLFDTKSNRHGGTGISFDWTLLFRNDTDKMYFLSGGIGEENIGEVLQIADPRIYALDLNSRFEQAPGVKDINKLTHIFKRLKNQSA